MEKYGEVKKGITPCCKCGKESCLLYGSEAYCASCAPTHKLHNTTKITKIAEAKGEDCL